MKSSKVFLKPFQKRALYWATALLWLSGALWLYYKYFGQVQGDYGLQTHPAQPILLEIHGAAAMAFLIIFGTLLVQHVPLGWQQKRQRPSGAVLVAISAVLVVTGWGLYYVVGGALRQWIGWMHWIPGLVLPLILLVHLRGRKAASKADLSEGPIMARR